MGLVAKFTAEDLRRQMAKRMDRIEQAIIMRLSRMGKMCRNEAIENRGYTDQTSNLKSSVGYVIVANGKIVGSKFQAFDSAGDGESTGRRYAESLAAKYNTGYALIVVAGMEYAVYVEANGWNVLSTAEHLAERELPKSLAQISKKIGSMV